MTTFTGRAGMIRVVPERLGLGRHAEPVAVLGPEEVGSLRATLISRAGQRMVRLAAAPV
ncbi:hypothetical protein ACFXA2_29310 [Micromonospora chalcea]